MRVAPVVIEDARECICPVFSVRTEGNGVFLESRVFLGTAFLVSSRGDAITAGHVLRVPGELQEGHRLVAVVVRDGREEVCWITHAAAFAEWDVSLLHVNLTATKYLPISAAEVVAGADIQILGITDHEVWGGGKEMRILKGHVTMAASRWLELSCSVPMGMSGSPLFMEGRVVGCVIGTLRTEQVEDSTEETREASGQRERIRGTQVRRVFHYGRAFPFAAAAGTTVPVLGNKTLLEFVQLRNEVP